MKILVMDDHDAFRDEIVTILARHGHAAHGVSMATSAVALVEKGDYDVVLVDYNMPVHDGLWFMRNAKIPRRTKVILVTAQTNQRVIDSMKIYGVSDYLIKPFDEEDLMRHLDFHSNQGQAVPKDR